MKSFFFLVIVALLSFINANVSVAIDVSTAEQLSNCLNNNVSEEINLLNNISLGNLYSAIWVNNKSDCEKVINGNGFTVSVADNFTIDGKATYHFNNIKFNIGGTAKFSGQAPQEVFVDAKSSITTSNIEFSQSAFIEFGCYIDVTNNLNINYSPTLKVTDSGRVTVGGKTKVSGSNATFDCEFVTNGLDLSGGNTLLTFGNNAKANVGAVLVSGSPNIVCNGAMKAESVYLNGGNSSLLIGEKGTVVVANDLSAVGSAVLEVGGGGQIGVGGNVNFSSSVLAMESGSHMYVDGDFSVANGNTMIDGALNVQGDFAIEWNNSNGNGNGKGKGRAIGDITGNGELNVQGDFFCKGNNTVSGQECVNQLGNYFPVQNINGGSSKYDNPLPIVLSYFGAELMPNCTNIYWTTESETNNDYFTIYRSVDGVDYEPIAEVQGAGNSTIVQNYTFVDYEPLEGVSYYVLGQTDYDGEMKYSKPVAVERGANEVNIYKMALYPNPYNNNGLTIDFGFPLSCRAKVVITNMVGNVVSQVECNLSGNELRLMPNLKSGVYFVTAFVGGETIIQKLVVE